jgi:hypothetical protein
MFAATAKVGLFVAKEWKWVIVGVSTFLVLIIMLITGIGTSTQQEQGQYSTQGLSPEVMAYEPLVRAELQKYGLENLTPILLAIMQQETGGKGGDPLQCSESLGLAPNSITDPLYSIQVGVSYFVDTYNNGNKKGVDIKTIVQSYNFGGGYIDYSASNGGVHTEDLAKQYSDLQMQKHPGIYTCGGNTSNFRYPHCYGDWSYATKVFSYLTPDGQLAAGSPLGDEAYQALMNELLKYQGYPYHWGGNDPSTSFDCSGLVQWGFKTIGYNLPRTAQEQYNSTKRIQKEELKPGDLVFFKTADYNSITHVGIYVGNNRMYDSNDNGVGYSDLYTTYWTSRTVGYGRVN